MTTLVLLGSFGVAFLLSLGSASLLDPLLPFPFPRILSRCLLVFGLIASYLFRKRFQKKSFRSLGLEKTEDSLPLLIKGIAFALLSLLVLTGVTFLCKAAIFEYHPLKPKKLFYYAVGAILTGFLEEIFFRGILLQSLLEDVSKPMGIFLSNLVYSLLHFVIPLLLHKPADLSLFYSESVGLFLFGILMAYAYFRTHSLYLSIGLHGGFVFFLKMDNVFVNRLNVSPPWLFGEEKIIGGIVTWLLFLVAFPWVRWVGRTYLPMQNCEKIRLSKSSVNTSPTISPKA